MIEAWLYNYTDMSDYLGWVVLFDPKTGNTLWGHDVGVSGGYPKKKRGLKGRNKNGRFWFISEVDGDLSDYSDVVKGESRG